MGDPTFGERLREQRQKYKAQGFTQQAMADALRLKDKRTVAAWEADENMPQAGHRKLVEAFVRGELVPAHDADGWRLVPAGLAPPPPLAPTEPQRARSLAEQVRAACADLALELPDEPAWDIDRDPSGALLIRVRTRAGNLYCEERSPNGRVRQKLYLSFELETPEKVSVTGLTAEKPRETLAPMDSTATHETRGRPPLEGGRARPTIDLTVPMVGEIDAIRAQTGESRNACIRRLLEIGIRVERGS